MPEASEALPSAGRAYTLHGLNVESPLPLAELPEAPSRAAVDISLRFSSRLAAADPTGHEVRVSDGELSAGRSSDGAADLRFPDGARFVVASGAGWVEAGWPTSLSFEDALAYLVGPVTAICLVAKGRICLHASVVAVAGRAVALVGSSGAGKSTTAAAFARAGGQVVSDDLLVLRTDSPEHLAYPGSARLRLWPPSAVGLFGDEGLLPEISPGWGKRYLDLRAEERFQAEPLPLGAIYVLGPPSEVPKTRPLSPREAILNLLAHSYVGPLLTRSERVRELRFLGDLVRTVKARELSLPDRWERLDELPELVEEEMQEGARTP